MLYVPEPCLKDPKPHSDNQLAKGQSSWCFGRCQEHEDFKEMKEYLALHDIPTAAEAAAVNQARHSVMTLNRFPPVAHSVDPVRVQVPGGRRGAVRRRLAVVHNRRVEAKAPAEARRQAPGAGEASVGVVVG